MPPVRMECSSCNSSGAGFLQLKVHAPERVAGDQEFDSYTEHAPLFAANSDHAGSISFPGQQIGQLHLASHTGEDLHVQQAALHVDFAGLRVLDDDAAAGLLPFGLYRDDYRETAASALFRFLCRRRDEFFHEGGSSTEAYACSILEERQKLNPCSTRHRMQ